MANIIQLKRSTTGGNTPTLNPGELAVNLVDKRLFTANNTTVFDAVQNVASDFTISGTTQALRVGNSTVNSVVNSSSVIINSTNMSTFTYATTGTSPQEADSWLKSSYRSCEYYISVKDDAANAYLSTKINVLHAGDAANVYYTEYGKIWSNTEITTFSANANTTHVRFWVTPTPAATTLTLFRTNIAV